MRALILEPDVIHQNYLRTQAEAAGFLVDISSNIKDARLFLMSNRPDIIIMSMESIKHDGVKAIRHWRREGQNVKILVINNIDNLHHKVNVLNSGADDYVVKPYVIEEVIARMHALTRRSSMVPTQQLIAGKFEVNLCSKVFYVDNNRVRLTNYEYEIMMLLIKNFGKKITKEKIMKHIYDDWVERSNNTVEILISRLRKKIAPYNCGEIKKQRGDGYYFETIENYC